MPTLRRVACILVALSLGRGAVPVEPPVEGWRSVYDGPGASADAILAVTTDAAGRPIVAVSSSIEGQGCSGTIRKSGLDGTALWEAEEQNFRPIALAVGPGESVVVAGEMQVEVQVGSTLRPAVVKYGPDGERLWRRDLLKFTVVCGVAVDAAGAVFVPVGATVEKLGPDGSTIWAAARDGFQPLRFAPLDGGLVLAGYEQGAGIQRWRTVRFGPGGDEEWSIPFGPADKDGAFIIAVAVAADGDLVVCGAYMDPESRLRAVVARYAPDGNVRWEVPMGDDVPGATPAAAVLDAAGNAVVVGKAEFPEGSRVFLEKVAPDGRILWTRTRGPWDGDWTPRAVGIDGLGNIVAAGARRPSPFSEVTSWAAAAFDSTGSPAWYDDQVRGERGARVLGLAVAQAGTAYVYGVAANGKSGDDGLVVAYGPDGRDLWTAQPSGEGPGYDAFWALAVDPSGTVVVAGYSSPTPWYGNRDLLVMKYDSAGLPVWQSVFDGGGEVEEDLARAVAIDPSGSIFVTGSMGTVGYGSGGDRRWARAGPAGLDAVAVPEGGVLVAGSGDGKRLLTRLAPDGTELWVVDADGPGEEWCTRVLLDGSEPIVLVQKWEAREIVRLSPEGARVWTVPGDAWAIAVDDLGFTIGVGSTVQMLDRSGGLVWEHPFRYPSDGNPATEVAVTRNGDIVAVGFDGGGPEGRRLIAASFDRAGRESWRTAIDGGLGDPLVATAGDRIALAAIVASDGLVFEHVLAFYDLAGNLEARTTYPQYPSALIADGPGDIYLAGWGRKAGRADDDGILRMFPGEGPSFLRGDCDGDGVVGGNVTDAVVLLLYAFAEGGEPPCLAACDVDGDAQPPGVTDAIWLLRFSFLGEAAPAPPFPECGTDRSTPLSCSDSASCL